ncbi:MAG: class I SAM-dependent methyltransferase [Planctomycetes bacterium]|nr:class I SAM-dependent methyltransferase [Planctomycetota bacterium]
MEKVATSDVRSFWDQNPLCATQIPHPLGSKEYFEYFDDLRERIDSLVEASVIHEFAAFGGKRGLEVGCGNGYVLSRYAQHGAEVDGVDITPTAVDLCRQRFTHMNLAGAFREADAEQLPFADATFDCVCSMGVLHHVSDTARAVAEIHRVLKPGGRLIVMFYHRNSAPYHVNLRLRAWTTSKTQRQLVNEFDGVGNPKGEAYTRAELTQLLGSFENPEMRVRFLERHMLLPKVGKFIPRFLLRPLEGIWGFNLYAKGRKAERAAEARAA